MTDYSELRNKNIALTKKAVKESIGEDQYIINTVNNIEELQRMINILSKRLREWYSLYLPELDHLIEDHQTFVKLVLEENKDHLISELKVKKTMGADLKKEDLKPIFLMAETIKKLEEQSVHLEKYLEKIMKVYCQNLDVLAGSVIGAKLIRGAGSLKQLAFMRSSTVQLIGAEKALFRHIKTGARSPKYGYIINHPLVQKAKKQDKGKIARILADKIFIAVRIDYFKGEFQGNKLLKEVEEKIK